MRLISTLPLFSQDQFQGHTHCLYLRRWLSRPFSHSFLLGIKVACLLPCSVSLGGRSANAFGRRSPPLGPLEKANFVCSILFFPRRCVYTKPAPLPMPLRSTKAACQNAARLACPRSVFFHEVLFCCFAQGRCPRGTDLSETPEEITQEKKAFFYGKMEERAWLLFF